MTAMMLGKNLTNKKRRVGWEIWCLGGLALFMIMKLFITNYVKKDTINVEDFLCFYIEKSS